MANITLDFFGIPINSSTVADLILLVALIVTAILSVVFYYHWKKFGLGGPYLAIAEITYLAGVVILVGAAFYSIS